MSRGPGDPMRLHIGAPGRLAAALILTLMLAACESTPEAASAGASEDPNGVAAKTAATANPEDSAPADEEASAEAVSEVDAAPSPSALAALTTAPVKASEPTIDDDPQQLYGLDSEGLGELLGEPSLIRNEDPAEIWQYRGRTCVFDIFLYQGADRRRVTYVEARDESAQRIDARTCLHELLRARMGLEPVG